MQAVNDFIVFGLQGFGSLGAGVLQASVGWNGMLTAAVPGLLILLTVIIFARRFVIN